MSTVSKKNIPYYIFLFLLIFTPLAFGSDELWSLTIMEALCLATFLFYFCNPQNLETVYRVPGVRPLILLLCFMLLQIVPVPAVLVGIISPATLAIYQGTIGVVEMPAWIPLSINPRITLDEFFRFSAYASFYILSIQLLTDSRRLKKTVLIVLGLCSFIALQSIVQKSLGNGKIYWFREVPPNSSFIGPYFYHNHFAGFVEMLVPVAIALFFRYRPLMHYGNSWRQRLANSLGHQQFNTHLLLGFASVLMGVSIFVSLSRGGIISFVLSCFILLVVLACRRKNKFSIHLGLVLLAGIFLAVTWLGWDVIDQHFGVMFDLQGELQEARPVIWHDSIGIIKDFPVAGTGWGTFADIYPTYRTHIEKDFTYYAHNGYIETFINGGIVSLALIAWFLGAVFLNIGKTLIRRKNSYAEYLTWGSLAGILAIIIHSVLDFNLQNGANGLYFFFLLALAVSASHTRLHGKKATKLMPQKKRGALYVGVFCSGLLLLTSLGVNCNSLRINGQLADIEPLNWNKDTPVKELHDIKTQLDRTMKILPLNPNSYFLLAEVHKTIGNDAAADQYYRKAIRRIPTRATYLQNYGIFLEKNGKHSLADSFMQAGIRHDLIEPDRKRNYARFLFSSNEKEKGLQVMSTVFAQDPKKAENDIAFLIDSGFSDDDIRMNIPAKVIPLLAFADYLEQKGDQEQAAALYRQALTHINDEEDVQPDYFYRISRFFSKQQRYEEGLAVILQAIGLFPADAGLRVAAGNLYREMGLTHRAIEEYQQALAIDQGNPQARKHLAKLQQTTDTKIKL